MTYFLREPTFIINKLADNNVRISHSSLISQRFKLCESDTPLYNWLLIRMLSISGKDWGDPSSEPWLAIHGWLDNAGKSYINI